MENIKSFRPSGEAIRDYLEHTEIYMKRTAWATHCRSWFKNGKQDGPVTALHPGSRLHWFHMMANPRWEDWEWEGFDSNRFSYLGNGFTVLEDEGRDTTWYFDSEEGYERLRY